LLERAPQERRGFARVVPGRRSPELGEDVVEQAAVLEGERDARRDADVVFEHEPPAVAVAHDVEAADVRPARGTGGRGERAVTGAPAHEPYGQDAVPDDRGLAVDVLEERVEGARPLRGASLDAAPLFAGHDARDDVDGERRGTVAARRAKDDARRDLLALELRPAGAQDRRTQRRQRLEGRR